MQVRCHRVPGRSEEWSTGMPASPTCDRVYVALLRCRRGADSLARWVRGRQSNPGMSVHHANRRRATHGRDM